MNPDSYLEGLYSFRHQEWFIQNGRWLAPIMYGIAGNLVIIPMIFVIYCLCVIIMAKVIITQMRITSVWMIVIISVSLMVGPSVITQFLFGYSSYGIVMSLLFTVLYCVAIKRGGRRMLLAATLCITLMMGFYQTYIGAAAFLLLMISILDLFDGEAIMTVWKRIWTGVIAGVCGCAASVILGFIVMKSTSTEAVDRLSMFSVRTIVSSFGGAVIRSYKYFLRYFYDGMLGRRFLYMALFLVFAVCFFIKIMQLIRQGERARVLWIMLMVLALPFAANLVHILVPYNEITTTMQHHYTFVIAFGLALTGRVTWQDIRIGGWVTAASGVLCVWILWTYVISANATFMCNGLSHRVIDRKTLQILDDIYALDTYREGETKILFAGFPHAEEVRTSLPMYRYTIELPKNPVFWGSLNSATHGRYQYLLNTFGVDAGMFSEEEYDAVLSDSAFEQMPLWPEKGSVRMIDGYAVVKLSDNPPRIAKQGEDDE